MDHDPSSHKAIARLMQPSGYLIHSFHEPTEFVGWIKTGPTLEKPCCIVFDARYAELLEADTARRRLGEYPRICVSRSNDLSSMLNSVRLGLFAFVQKPFRLAQIANTIDQAFEHYRQQRGRSTTFTYFVNAVPTLTQRERQIMLLLAQGLCGKAIAAQLGISIKTFYVHRANVTEKTGVRSASDLARYYERFLHEHDGLRLAAGEQPVDESPP